MSTANLTSLDTVLGAVVLNGNQNSVEYMLPLGTDPHLALTIYSALKHNLHTQFPDVDGEPPLDTKFTVYKGVCSSEIFSPGRHQQIFDYLKTNLASFIENVQQKNKPDKTNQIKR